MSGPTIEALMHALQVEATLAGLPNFSFERQIKGGAGVYYRAKFGQSQTNVNSPAANVLLQTNLMPDGRLHVLEVFGDPKTKGQGQLLMNVIIQAARNARCTLLTAYPATPTGKALAEKLGITENVPGDGVSRGLTL